MDTTNSQNRPNQNTFSNNANVSDKHLDFVQPKPQQYINPNNFQKVLNNQNQVQQTPVQQQQPGQMQRPPQQQLQNQLPAQPVQPSPIRQSTPVAPQQKTIPQMQIDSHYDELKKEAKINATVNTHEILKLGLYVVPIIALFVHLLKSTDDKEVLWHARQSLVAQGVWFMVIIVLTLLDAPIFSSTLLTIWRIAGYLILIFAGAQAYLGQRYHIPLAYDIGKNFIEEKN